VKIQPNHANAHFNLGDAQRRSGRLTEARASMERALALQPNDAEAKALLETIHQELIRTGNPAAP
jgi:Flp pilus assembly protein TadD